MSNYNAIIAKITAVTPIKNSDYIQSAFVLGESVIVNISHKVGGVGVFFPVGCALSADMCHHNNLYRKGEMNKDQTKSGFLEANGRITSMKMRGAMSCGLFLPLESLNWAGNYPTKLGEKIGEINGHKICSRYNPPAPQNSQGGGNKTKGKTAPKFTAPYFEKHIDTNQFKYEVGKIQKGSTLYFHAKYHGCFKYDARVRMADGSVKSISHVNIGDMVLGWDESLCAPVPTRVTNVWENGQDSTEWCSVKVGIPHMGGGNSYSNTNCTADHQFLTSERGWICAKNLEVGETLIATLPSRVMSPDEVGALIGMHLGDGYMSRSFNMQFCHKTDHVDYVKWKGGLFGDMWGGHITNKVSGYGSDTSFTLIKSNKHVRKLFEGIENNEVADWMVDAATPLTLAIIYMDDGNLTYNQSQQDRASIACCSIELDSRDNFERIFNKFGIYPKFYEDTSGYYRAYFKNSEATVLWKLISPYIPEIMQYKFPVGWDFGEKIGITNGYQGFVETFATVLDVTTSTREYKKYDLETGTHTYIVSNNVVHNSSARQSMARVDRDLPKWQKTVNMVAQKIGINEVFASVGYEMVLGSRNVLINDKNTGFYGSHGFRYKAAEEITPHLGKGITVYSELVGYTDGGATIMPRHDITKIGDKKMTKKYGETVDYTYGCVEGALRNIVYRVTVTTDDGFTIDMPQKAMEMWCSQRDLEHTLEIHPPIIYDGDEDALRELVDRLTERPDVMTECYDSPTQISEGIIIREECGTLIPRFYKSKSFYFRLLEGHNVEADMEEQS